MSRRWSAFLLLLFLSVLPATAQGLRSREIGGAGDGTPLGPPAGGLARPGLLDEEPYRNADIGHLGVVLSNGEFQTTITDLEIPGRGFPLQLTRTYRSRRDAAESLLGWNWHLGFDEFLQPGSYSLPGGLSAPALEWTQGNGWRNLFIDAAASGQYEPFGGFFGKLRSLGVGRGYQIRYPDGTVKTFALSARRPGGLPAWMLTRVEDRNGNALTLQYRPGTGTQVQVPGTLTDTLGRTISLTYDGANRLIRATDFAGRSLEYVYDAAGNLIKVKVPEVRGDPSGDNFCDPSPSAACPHPRRSTVYGYLTTCPEGAYSHNLVTITDGAGRVTLRNSYTSQSGDPACGARGGLADAVASQVWGAGTIRYAYQPTAVPPDAGVDALALTTTVTDANGNIEVHEFNPQGNPLRVVRRTNRAIRSFAGVDEPDYVETYRYLPEAGSGGSGPPMIVSRRAESGGMTVDGQGSLVAYPEGMSEEYHYDQENPDPFQRGNLLRAERNPAPGAVETASLVSIYEYEPVFNQPLTVTGPAGHTTQFTYDYQEGDASDLTAAGPNGVPASVDPGWWSAAEMAAIHDFLALHGRRPDDNRDGYHRGGNRIAADEGAMIQFDGSSSGDIVTRWAYNRYGLPVLARDAELNETRFLYHPENDPDGDGVVTPGPPDGRVLSEIAGADGGGYLQERFADAPASLPAPPGPGRDGGHNPTPANVRTSFRYDPPGNVVSVTNGRGIRTDATVNALNQVVEVVRAAASADPLAPALAYHERFRHDAGGNLIQHRAERRDDSGGSPGPPSRWITRDIAYDPFGRKESESVTTDDSPPLSLTTRYAYDPGGNLVKTVFPSGNAVLRFYDERDLMFREVVPAGPSPDPANRGYDPAVDAVTTYGYDGSGRLIQLIDPEGHEARTGYDGYGRKAVGFDPLGQRSTFAYDAAGRVTMESTFGAAETTAGGPPPGGYPEISHRRFFYDSLGRQRRVDVRFFVHEGGIARLLDTDGNAGLGTTAEGDPPAAVGDGWVTSLVRHDRLGRPVETVDDHGHRTETWYDGLGRVLSTLSPVAFPFAPRPAAPLDGRNAVDFVYDAEGNRLEMRETEWGADRGAGSVRLLAPQTFRTTFAYDAMNRRVETRVDGRVGSPPLGWTSTAAYDSRGNLIQETDSDGRRTRRFHDGMNRLVRTESGYLWDGQTERIAADLITPGNPDGRIVTAYAYDPDGRVITRTDDAGRVTRYRYDGAGRRIASVRPDATEEVTRFDRDGLPSRWELRHFSGALLRVDSAHDSLHHLILRQVDNSGAPMFTGSRLQTLDYDGTGNMVRAVAAGDPADTLLSSEVRRRFDSMGNRVSEIQITREMTAGSEQVRTYEVRGVFDGTGLRQAVIHPGGREITFHQDEVHRLESLADSYTGTTRFDYLGPSRLLNRIQPNGTRLTFFTSSGDPVGGGYDAARRIVHFSHQRGAAPPFVELDERLDSTGNRLSSRRVHEPAGALWMGESFGYDGVQRMISRREGMVDATGAPAGAATDERSYTLDGPGNWTAWRRGVADYPNQVNALDQYQSFNDPSGKRTFGYDPAGNLTSERLPGWLDRLYAYDSQGRMVTYLDPGSNLYRYRHDALGRRIAKVRNGLVLVRYIYDGPRLIEERDDSGAMLQSYLHGEGSDQLIGRRRWSGSTAADLTYHTDRLGSVVAVTDSSGAVVERYRYDAYGEPAFLAPDFTPRAASSVLNTFLFAGRPRDPESGLYDFRARTYSPSLGRFLQRDPLGESTSPNLYAYVGDNPVNRIDPTGLITMPAAGGINPALRLGWSLIRDGSTGWDLSRRMNYRGGSHVSYTDAQYGGFEQAQADEDHYIWLENENAEWQAKAARQHAVAVEHLKKIVEMLKEQFNDPLNQENMEDPLGVEVNFYGIFQDYREEQSGNEDKSELDTASGESQQAGAVVFNLNGQDMAAVSRFSDTAEAALALIAGVVRSVTGQMCGGPPVVINGFSLGGSGAVDITNRLTAGGAFADISLRLIDAYLDSDSHRVDSMFVNVTTWESRGGIINAATHIGAWFLGLSRGVSQGEDLGLLHPITLSVPHTLMDTYIPGALGTPGFLGY